jgi:hypothetical protein
MQIEEMYEWWVAICGSSRWRDSGFRRGCATGFLSDPELPVQEPISQFFGTSCHVRPPRADYPPVDARFKNWSLELHVRRKVENNTLELS